MNNTEQTLLSGALQSVQTMILHGLVSSEAETIAAVMQLRGAYESLDLRQRAFDAESLRIAVKKCLAKSPTLVVRLPHRFADGTEGVFAELTRGVVEISDAPEQLAEDVRIIALSAEKDLSAGTGQLFGLQISGMRVIEEQRAAIRQAEKELLAAQKRARESSRQHGLV